MRSFKWGRDYAIYVADLDNEHKAMFEALQELTRVRTADLPESTIQELVAACLAQSAKHFAHEERLMRATFYRSFAWHKRQHDNVRNHIAALEPALSNGDREAVLALLDFIGVWLEHHIRITDRLMGAYVQNYRCANPVAWAS